MRFITISFFIIMLIGSSPGNACTTFAVKDASNKNFIWFGRNYDRDMRDTLVMVNPKNVNKRALTTVGNPAEWNSTFGSVTFNQYGRDFPLGGMNEKGLVVEVMILPHQNKNYIKGDSVSAAQWVQYQLDTAENMKEVIANANSLSHVDSWNTPLHYLV